MKIKTYTKLERLDTFEERFRYLALHGDVGRSTFGFDRHINQQFYRSREWRRLRQDVIIRDQGCDLGVEGYDIHGQLLIHHINPLMPNDIIHSDPDILNSEFLITTTLRTHNAIHFGDERQLPRPLASRRSGDTKLW